MDNKEEVGTEQQTFDVLAVPCDRAFVVTPEKAEEFKNTKALFDIVKGQNGICRKLQITKEQSKLTFPFEPMYWFYQGTGYFYLKDFIVLDNWLALNTTNLDGFRSYKI